MAEHLPGLQRIELAPFGLWDNRTAVHTERGQQWSPLIGPGQIAELWDACASRAAGELAEPQKHQTQEAALHPVSGKRKNPAHRGGSGRAG